NPEWRDLTIPDGGFRIQVRGEPRVEKNDLPTPLGVIHTEWYSVEARDGVFGVGYADYPEAALRQSGARTLFTTVRESWLKRIDGKLIGEGTDVTLEKKHPGIDFSAAGKLDGRDAYLRGRFYLVGNRMYQIIAFGNRSAMPISEINQFMGS